MKPMSFFRTLVWVHVLRFLLDYTLMNLTRKREDWPAEDILFKNKKSHPILDLAAPLVEGKITFVIMSKGFFLPGTKLYRSTWLDTYNHTTIQN